MSGMGARSTFEVSGPTGQPQLIDTENLVFWVAVVATVYSGFHWIQTIPAEPLVQALPAINWAAMIQWALYGGVLLAVIYHHQLFVRRSRVIVTGAVLWGGIVATWFASKANAAGQDLLVHRFGIDAGSDWVLAIAATTNEESLKVLGVIVLVLLPLTRVRSTLDGLFYGMIIGLAFQVFEDYIYTIQNSTDLSYVFGYLIARGFVSGLFAHAMYTGITGAGIGFFVSRRDLALGVRIAVAVGAFAAAWTVHLLWDSPLLNDLPGGRFTTILVKGIPTLAIIVFSLRAARNSERAAWNRFVEARIDSSLLTSDDVAALQTLRTRRAARSAAADAGGRRAKEAEHVRQNTLLRYVQAVAEEGVDSERAQRHRDGLVD